MTGSLSLTQAPDADYALRTASERGVRFVRLWFVDVLGTAKAVAIPVSELETALEDGVGVDGSALEGVVRPNERDVVAVPDPRTFQILPWRPRGQVARMFCELRTPQGAVSPSDSRAALCRVIGEAAELGYAFHVGAEVEFFVFASSGSDADVDDGAPPIPLDRGSYFDLTPLDGGSDFRREAIEHLEATGIPVKASHHEVAPSQHEIDLEHTDALAMADSIVTFRVAVKEVAQAAGVFATFMPKPLERVAGSGLHLHLSLADEQGRNLFHEPGEPLSDLGRAFLAGVLAHSRETFAATNQWTNSYKRLIRGFEAPESATWTRGGRSSLVRVPVARLHRPETTRIELRSPDPGCNPYLALGLILAAGLRGIERDYQLPPADDDAAGGPPLPADLREAVELFGDSELVRDVLGERLTEAFMRNKEAELADAAAEVTPVERRRLLRTL